MEILATKQKGFMVFAKITEMRARDLVERFGVSIWTNARLRNDGQEAFGIMPNDPNLEQILQLVLKYEDEKARMC